MSKKFVQKIMKTGTVDTKKYRYALREFADRMEIIRIELYYLDTTAEWETVKTIG